MEDESLFWDMWMYSDSDINDDDKDNDANDLVCSSKDDEDDRPAQLLPAE